MPDKKFIAQESKTGKYILSKEPRAQHEPPQPTTLPEMSDDGATTGRMILNTEGKDHSAALDTDSGQEG
jgi:hypothetical protein